MPTRAADLIDAIQSIRVWKRGDDRAPNKPLLLLYALGRVQRGEGRLVPFSELEGKVNGLLKNYGRDSKAESPFWHLTSDGLWEVPGGNTLKLTKGDKRPILKELRTVSGGFPEEVHTALAADPDLLRRVVRTVLDEHFPPSYHDALVTAGKRRLSETGRGHPKGNACESTSADRLRAFAGRRGATPQGKRQGVRRWPRSGRTDLRG